MNADTSTTDLAHLEGSTQVLDRDCPAIAAEAGGSALQPEVVACLNEVKRLCGEAEERLGSGAVLPALSSLTAVLPLHKMLVGRCSAMLEPSVPERQDEPAEPADAPTGFYL